jgi:hypothetical protein
MTALFVVAPFLGLAPSLACTTGTTVQPGPDGSTALQDANVVDAAASSADSEGSGSVSAAEAATDAVDGPETTEPSEGSVEDAPTDEGTTASDTGSTAPPNALETIDVPAAGAPVTSKTSLASGALYLLEANGSVPVGTEVEDAEFASAPNGTGVEDIVNGVDVGIETGLLQPHPPNGGAQVTYGPGRTKWFGSFSAVHVYYMIVTGAGQPLTLKLVTSGSASSGSIPVSLFLLAPKPPATDTPATGPKPAPPAPPGIGVNTLETLQSSNQRVTVKSNLTGASGTVYLLQASGATLVGAGNLGMGDAEYDDWSATGAGANNNDGPCDFGIGVDETGHDASGACDGPRMRWWGPYRNDHIYYMLYTGTGNPLSLFYVDSNYGDNVANETYTINIFPTPPH